MTQSQSNWLNMFCAVQKLCQNHKAVVEKEPSLVAGINSIGQLIAGIQCIASGSSRDSIYAFSRTQTALALAFARDTENRELKSQLEFSKEVFLSLSDEELKLKLQFHFELVQLLGPRLAVYGVNASALKAWELLLQNYMPKLDSPKAAILRKQQLTVCFSQLFKDALNLCTDYLDPLVDSLKKKFPDFYTSYLEKRCTENPGDAGVKIKGIVKTRGNDAARKSLLSAASITLVETGVVVKSDKEGLFSFRSVRKGTYSLRAEKAGYYTKISKSKSLKEGESLFVEFELVLVELLQD
ncbi:MAG: carboxypeptidase-like regulatory domain-containing protein [Bacteroidia bacterium]